MNEIVRMLAYGKHVAKLMAKSGNISWDDDSQTIQFKSIRLMMRSFKEFIHDVIDSAELLLHNELLFGVRKILPINLNKLCDRMTETKRGFSIMDELSNGLRGGYRYMLDLVKLATPDKRLLKADDEWDRKRVLEYLGKKERFLELLMLAMHMTGGQPARGSELGSIKFRNSMLTTRNVFVIGGNVFYVTEYHKARAATNYSHHVVRYLPSTVGRLLITFISFIRPFTDMLYNQITFKDKGSDGDYVFSSEDKSESCWDGKKLAHVLERESMARLGFQLNISSYRHIVIGIAKEHLRNIAGYFDWDDAECDKFLSHDKDIVVYAWQTGHQRATNVSTYGLDKAYPGNLQPELLRQYLRISRVWHGWIGLLEPGVYCELGEKCDRGVNKVLQSPQRKRQNIDKESSINPQKRQRTGECDLQMSPASRKIMEMQNELQSLLEYRKEERALRERYNM